MATRNFLGQPPCFRNTEGSVSSGAGQRKRFSHVDHVSVKAMPWGTSFLTEAGEMRRVFGISALALESDMQTLLALCDRSRILSAQISFDNSSLELADLKWTEERDVRVNRTSAAAASADDMPDVEGMALLPNGMLYTASEPGQIFKLPGPHTWPEHGGELLATQHKLLPRYVQDSMVRHNRGFESLAYVPVISSHGSGSTFRMVAGFEGALKQDAKNVRRLVQFTGASDEVLCERMLIVPESDPELFLTEVAPLDDRGLCDGGQFLILLRGWNKERGNDIRMYLANTAGADDIRRCSSITEGAMHDLFDDPTSAYKGCDVLGIKAIDTELLLKWTPQMPLGGVVPVDNYEGMMIVPPAAFGRKSTEELGGVSVLLVNDDNDNPKQGGTQFVLLRLAYAQDADHTDCRPSVEQNTINFQALRTTGGIAGLSSLSSALRSQFGGGDGLGPMAASSPFFWVVMLLLVFAALARPMFSFARRSGVRSQYRVQEQTADESGSRCCRRRSDGENEIKDGLLDETPVAGVPGVQRYQSL